MIKIYFKPTTIYSIPQIKKVIEKLDPSLRVSFDNNNKNIQVIVEIAKKFVEIIRNTIVQRVISGETAI